MGEESADGIFQTERVVVYFLMSMIAISAGMISLGVNMSPKYWQGMAEMGFFYTFREITIISGIVACTLSVILLVALLAGDHRGE